MVKSFSKQFISGLIFFGLTLTLSTAFAQDQKIKWVSLEEAEALRRTEPRKILIDVYTDWCGWCKRMDKTTFSEAKLVEYVNANYYAVKLDAEQREPITLGGKTYEYVEHGRRGYNQIAKELLQDKMSYPTVVFLDENMNMIQPLAGYRDAKEMQPILEYLATNGYKETPWEDWLKARAAN
ncbi:MAG: thioredoxin family protein [Flavobacteriales bacterium]